jgi:hypothetical protein
MKISLLLNFYRTTVIKNFKYATIMKQLLVLYFFFSSLFCFSQNFKSENDKKNAIGFFAAPISYVHWFAPDYIGLTEDRQGSDFRRTFIKASPIGIGYQRAVNNLFKIQIGVFGTTETKKYTALPFNNKVLKNVDYKAEYVNVPLNVRFFLGHILDEETLGGFFIELGAEAGFITKEHLISNTYTERDFRLPPSPYPYVDPNYNAEELNSAKLKFNRICPTLALGQEIVGDHLSFFYGGRLQLPSTYQERNTFEYFKNFKIALVNVGLSYRF